MKLGIMQPYFFPYLGYFSLIDHVDKWVIFDDVQYIEKGWINRNRIIHPTEDAWMYFTVPVCKHHREEKIKNITIDRNRHFETEILGKIRSSYKKRAPYYKEVLELFEDCLFYKAEHISEYNEYAMQKVCEYLNISFDYQVYSKMNLNLGEVKEAGDWALEISKAMGADEYVNPIGGRFLFDIQKFKQNNIQLSFLEQELIPYNQKKKSFIEGLSMIDVMMFNSKDEIQEYMKNARILQSNCER